MAHISRRSVLRGSLAVAAARTFAGPHIAKAAATTASVWFAQGFVQDEDVALRKAVADYEKASGNKIELSITPFAPERQKIIAAITSGVVPDVMANNPNEILQIYAWQDRWIDVSDVVDTQKALFSETALQSAQALQQRHQEARHLRRAGRGRRSCPATSGDRWSRRLASRSRTSRRRGTPTSTSSRRCRTICASRASARCMAWASR